ncbi:desampylase [Halorubrum aethiopicum]|uniref:desampylase n=1 Tax=Halorubrum aethiopicum TaxID=1758255 RepID=UPI0008373311|nr:desampylase [Halorubrum aethiopicum]
MIEFTRAAYDAVVDHAVRGGDAEVCGVLAGERLDEDAGGGGDGDFANDARDRSLVTEIRPTENAAETPETRYRIDPEEAVAVVESLESDGYEVVGFYHSHPAGPARPSGMDVARATWVGYSYAICALDGHPFVGSWRWRGEESGFDRETVAIRSE